MPSPTVELLGAYRLEVSPELFAQAMEWKYPYVRSAKERTAAEEHVRSELSGAVLLEVLVKDRDERFRVDDFGQTGSDQAAYSEVYLSQDGTSVISELLDVPNDRTLRIAFFFHFLDPMKPLNTSYGPVRLTTIQRMPQRLADIITYEPVT